MNGTGRFWRFSMLLGVAMATMSPRQVQAQAGADSGNEPTDDDLAAAFPDLGDMNMRSMMLEDPLETLLLFDQLELHDADDRAIWDLKAWTGRDFDKLLLRSEGERAGGSTEHAEVEALWAHTIAPWWDLVAGVRRDLEPGPSRTWAAFGVQGLSPYAFDIETTAYIGESSRAAVRLEAEYELLITQRLILQPLAELTWYSKGDTERGLGSGLASIELGARLRYEIRREFAPYVGVARSRSFGDTADLARLAGRDTAHTNWVLGVRVWF